MIFGGFGSAELSTLYVCIALLTYRESTRETCLKRPPSQGLNSKPSGCLPHRTSLLIMTCLLLKVVVCVFTLYYGRKHFTDDEHWAVLLHRIDVMAS